MSGFSFCLINAGFRVIGFYNKKRFIAPDLLSRCEQRLLVRLVDDLVFDGFITPTVRTIAECIRAALFFPYLFLEG